MVKLVLDHFQFKVKHEDDGSATLIIQPVETVARLPEGADPADNGVEPEITTEPTGFPIMAMMTEEGKERMIAQLSGKPAAKVQTATPADLQALDAIEQKRKRPPR